MQPLIIVEACQTFASVGLVEIARDDPGIAAGFGDTFAGSGRNEGDLLSIRRPRNLFAHIRQRRVGAGEFRERGRAAAIGTREPKVALVAIIAPNCDPLAIAGPHRTAGGLVPAQANALLRAQIQSPEWAIGPAGAVTHRNRIGNVVVVGRERYAADGAHARKVTAR